jgi:hypothetical protein
MGKIGRGTDDDPIRVLSGHTSSLMTRAWYSGMWRAFRSHTPDLWSLAMAHWLESP